MSAVRSKRNASTELRLLSMFRTAQITGWRREYKLYGRPDIVFPEARLAVFVDGCFWHGCPKHYRLPRTNKAFWLRKITRNKERDREVAKELRKRGWRFVRLWECAMRTEPRKSLLRVARALVGTERNAAAACAKVRASSSTSIATRSRHAKTQNIRAGRAPHRP